MAVADVKYKKLLLEILDRGVWDKDGHVRPKYIDGTPAYSKSIFGEQIKFEKGEIPIITSKRVPVQSSINEVVHAFFRLKTVNIVNLRELGITYWDEWANKDYTLGRSYAYQLKHQKELIDGDELDQVDAILYRLKKDPYSRRIMFSYWSPKDVHSKVLQECAWAGQFNVRNNQLDFLLIQRSVDSLLGLPSNWAGYYGLQCALANIFGYEVGTFTHQMGNVHLYENQIDLAKELILASDFEAPEIWVNPKIDNFYSYRVQDIRVLNYRHGKEFRSEVAI